ncbi:hypothetical protein AYI68_g622 [Smittium mucronatum]|uniref:Activator of Hsp90 ATPase AHSA1-like N-terminal domain-containing protein n=1 Tax=Smittium mucronatum TaxID=133383 RepID=A0A1R0H7W0_9FUNG|nr:hypothetical protein AYI68_g622 [Smittium mucronatum]
MSQANWKNVNNWHWTEKNCAEWAKKYFKNALVGLSFTGPKDQIVKITGIDSIVGDADLNQRKGKILTLYDLEIKLNWVGLTKGQDEKDGIKGTVVIPEVAHDSQKSDYVFDVRLNSDSKEGWELKELVRKDLSKVLIEEFVKFPEQLIKQNLGDVYINDDSFKANNSPTPKIKSSTNKEEEQPHVKAFKAGESGLTLSNLSLDSKKIDSSKFSEIKLQVELFAPARDVFDALILPEKVNAWTRSSSSAISPEPKTKFSLFGGNIVGEMEFVDFVGLKLVQKWRNNSWPEHHYSTVTIQLEQTNRSTMLNLHQVHVPNSQLESTTKNWEVYYFTPIKTTFGWGFNL